MSPDNTYLTPLTVWLVVAVCLPPLLALAFPARADAFWKIFLVVVTLAVVSLAGFVALGFAPLFTALGSLLFYLATATVLLMPFGVFLATARAVREFREEVAQERARAADPPSAAD